MLKGWVAFPKLTGPGPIAREDVPAAVWERRLADLCAQLTTLQSDLQNGCYASEDDGIILHQQALLEEVDRVSLLVEVAKAREARAPRGLPKDVIYARLRADFADSGETKNAFSLNRHGDYGLSRHQIRRVISDWPCATNAQPQGCKSEQTGTIKAQKSAKRKMVRRETLGHRRRAAANGSR